MKILRFSSLLILSLFALATSIEYSGFNIFYGIGQDTFSGYWGINESGNKFSEQNIGTFTSDTQLWILHHPTTIYLDEGDTVIEFDYKYRYGLMNQDPNEWIHPSLDYLGHFYNYEARYYAYWSLDHLPLFDLPLDSGNYYFEIALTATVVYEVGDTLTVPYVVPDSLPFIAYFSVIEDDQSGSEPSTPVTLIYFRVCEKKGKIELLWKTESETENSHFLVYRDYVVIGRIEGNGTCSDPHEYSFADNSVKPGVHEYAIKDVSYGGEAVMHDKVEVEVKDEAKVKVEEADFVMNKVYPNPFNPSTVIRLQYTVGTNVVVNIYNTQGVLVDQLINEHIDVGTYEVTWDASEMPSGIYIVRMVAGDVMQSQKVVLMK